MDFLEVLKSKLEGLSGIPSLIEIGTYNGNANSVAISPVPSQMKERYIDKGKVYPFPFQVLVHNKSNLSSYQMSQKFVEILDNKGEEFIKSKNSSFKLLNIEMTTTPNFVTRTDYGVLYTAIYTAELYIKGDGQ